jgi:hypothetical protein
MPVVGNFGLEGLGSNPAMTRPASARHQSRCFTRAKRWPSSLQPLVANFENLPGTVTRVKLHASHRKQTAGYTSIRNVAVHAFANIFASNPALGIPGSRTLTPRFQANSIGVIRQLLFEARGSSGSGEGGRYA